MHAPTTSAVLAALAIILSAGATTTKAVDFVRNSVDKKNRAAKWIWNVLAFGIGICVAYFSHLDAVSLLLPKTVHVAWWTTEVATGLAAGGAAGYFHELFDKLSSQAKAASPKA